MDEMTDLKKAQIVTLDRPCLVTPEGSERMRSRVVVLGPGEETGEHVTSKREELLIPLEGKAVLVGPHGEHEVSPGEAVFIPRDMKHNVINRSETPIRYIYVLALQDDYEKIRHHHAH
jgi:mannose-6-phosphate isomerase-like protein (cupin superfamily)